MCHPQKKIKSVTGTRVAIYCDLCVCQECPCIISFNPSSPLRQLQYEAGIIMKNYVVFNLQCAMQIEGTFSPCFSACMSGFGWAYWLTFVLRWMVSSMRIIKQFYLIPTLRASLYFGNSVKRKRVTKSNSPAIHLETEFFHVADVHIFLGWQNVCICISSICSQKPPLDMYIYMWAV